MNGRVDTIYTYSYYTLLMERTMNDERIICDVEDGDCGETERNEYFDAIKAQREESINDGSMTEDEYYEACWS